ncbi:MAG: DEAD/DEAH box helicase family protein, partial [Candidatus Elarobacter sp.]
MWATVDSNCQRVALAHELIQPGETFQLTADQRKAVDTITKKLDDGTFEFLLKAPTGSGKTEVMLRVAVDTILATDGYIVIL